MVAPVRGRDGPLASRHAHRRHHGQPVSSTLEGLGHRVPPEEVLAAAMDAGILTAVLHGRDHGHELPLARWTGGVTDEDRMLLDRCHGSTIDLGCGPGRLAEELVARGHMVLGVDAAEAAVARTSSRGVRAVRQDVFDPVPREGQWDTALLADGNIGIGGHPAALLSRVARVLGPGGQVVLDLAPPGTGLRIHRLHLRCAGLSSTTFSWAEVGPEALERVCAGSGLRVIELTGIRGRWVAVLGRKVDR